MEIIIIVSCITPYDSSSQSNYTTYRYALWREDLTQSFIGLKRSSSRYGKHEIPGFGA